VNAFVKIFVYRSETHPMHARMVIDPDQDCSPIIWGP
jgi:hypothetical protein